MGGAIAATTWFCNCVVGGGAIAATTWFCNCAAFASAAIFAGPGGKFFATAAAFTAAIAVVATVPVDKAWLTFG